MTRDNGWVVKKIQTLPADFFGTIELTVRAGAVRQVAETRTEIAPDVIAERQQALVNKANEGVRPIRAHDLLP